MGPTGTPPPPQGDSHRITTLLARKASKDWGWGQSRSHQAVPQAHLLCTPSPSGPSVESDSTLARCPFAPPTHPGLARASSATASGGKGLETPDRALKTQTSPCSKPSHALRPTSSPSASSLPLPQSLCTTHCRTLGLGPAHFLLPPLGGPPWLSHTASPALFLGAAPWKGCRSVRGVNPHGGHWPEPRVGPCPPASKDPSPEPAAPSVPSWQEPWLGQVLPDPPGEVGVLFLNPLPSPATSWPQRGHGYRQP